MNWALWYPVRQNVNKQNLPHNALLFPYYYTVKWKANLHIDLENFYIDLKNLLGIIDFRWFDFILSNMN